jgi:methylthioribulose-1-phosphate dehydratase
MIDLAAALANLSQDFYARGWMLGTSGNMSAVVSRNPLRLLITASGIDKGVMTPQHILSIDENGSPVEPADLRPSDERLLHVKLANHRNAGAVLHTHSVWSTVLSRRFSSNGAVIIEGYEMLKGLQGVHTHKHREQVPILDNDQDIAAIASRLDAMFDSFPEARAFLLEGHGLYTWGRDLLEAKRHAEVFEFLMEVVGRGATPG